MTIHSPKYGLILFTVVDSANLHGLKLPGSKTTLAQYEFGNITLHEFKSEEYLMRFGIFNFMKKLTLFFREEPAGLITRFILKGNVRIKLSSAQNFYLSDGQFMLLKTLDGREAFVFDKGVEHKIFDTVFSAAMLEQLFISFPSLKEFVSSANGSQSLQMRKPLSASQKMTEIVYDLLKCPYDEKLRRIYFEKKASDFLFEALVEARRARPPVAELDQREQAAIVAAKDLILADIKQHFTIAEISRQVRLNEFKLKTGFKRRFGIGIFEFLLMARMEEAKRQLIETDKPIKQIAALTGYDHLTNFITAFRKHFGFTPGSLRRK
jgi:AraC-like DNA-binding protein